MARTGRATVMVGERFEIREYPVPDPEPGTVLLRQETGRYLRYRPTQLGIPAHGIRCHSRSRKRGGD